MKSSVESLEGNKAKIYVEIEADEFESDIDRAFKAIAGDIKMPGFRNGKAPRKVLEARIGTEAARQQALRDAIPAYLSKAVSENNIDVIATTDVEITGGESEGDVEFEAEVETRPVITVPGYDGLRIELESLDLDDDEITAAQQAELKDYGTLVDADRASQVGDFLVLDLEAHRGDEEVLGLNTEDWSYELGQGWVTDDFDENLTDVAVGEILEFTSTPKGTQEEAQFKVTVKKIQTLELPEITDEWVADNTGEFETVAEWTDSITAELREGRLNQVRREISPKMTEALAALVDIELPEALVNAEMSQQFQQFSRMLSQQGMNLEQWLEMTGQDPQAMFESTRPQAELSVKVDLALRAVADAEGIEATDDDLDAEFDRMAMMFGRKAPELRKVYEDNNAVGELVAQIRKQKASDHLMETVEIVDTAGNPIDRDVLFGRNDDDDHDHDHDHDHADETETTNTETTNEADTASEGDDK